MRTMHLAAVGLLALAALLPARAKTAFADDVVVLENDVRLAGRILSEDSKGVVLEQSSGGGKTTLTIPRTRIRSIERDPAARSVPAPSKEGSPAGAASVTPVRDEWALLASDGKIVGTRHLTIGPTSAVGQRSTVGQSGDQASKGIRFEERVVLFGRPHVPGVSIHRIEETDERLLPVSFHYTETGEAGDVPAHAPAYETIRSGDVKGSAWTFAEREGKKARDGRLSLPAAARGPLAARETLARMEPRRTGLDDVYVVDVSRAEVRTVRLGFTSLDRGDGDARADVMRLEDGDRALESRWAPGQPPRCLSDEIAPGLNAVPASAAQAEAAAAEARAPAATPAPRREFPLPEVGVSVTLPGASWAGASLPSKPLDAGSRVVAKIQSALLAADVRVEWDPRGALAGSATPEDAEARLFERLSALCKDLRVVTPRAPVSGTPNAWTMTLEGTVRGERLKTLVLVADRAPARVTVLASSPAAAWGDAHVALESILASFRWL